MAIIEAISSKANIKRIISYVTQDNKTNINLITGKDCMAESCLEEMLYTKNLYHKNSGRQYIHIIQSFDPKDNLSAEQVHNIGIKLANTFNGFQVLVATHIDKNHLHNHLVINSVSFENGYKIQMSKKDLQYIKDYSDKLCLEIGSSVIPKKEKTNYIKRNEYRVAERGKSWKFKLMNAIDLSLAESNCKDDFIKNMNKLGYQLNWTDTRKYITYTTPEGYKCRDNKLYDEKYSKGAMENEFRRIKEEELKKNNQIVQENQVVPSIVKMDYYLIEPEIIKDLYQMEQAMVDDITIMKKKVQDTQEKLLKDNIRMNEQMKKLVEEKIKDQFYYLKQDLKQTEEEQKEKITGVKWKTGLVTFLVGLLLSAIWFLTHK